MKKRDILDVTAIPPGSLVAVRIADGIKPSHVREFADQMQAVGMQNPALKFVVMSEHIRLSELTDEQLAGAGLQRIPAP